MGDALLNLRARNNAQITQLRDSRAAGQRAETGALRKLERDIYDGPQHPVSASGDRGLGSHWASGRSASTASARSWVE